jgi:septal ring factor EnvC (AmiA/AmiB activator)
MLPFAQLPHPTDADRASLWLVVVALSTLASLGVSLITLVRFASGRSSERKVEPTEMHSIASELRSHTLMLNHINRETGELKTQILALDAKIDAQAEQIEGSFRRINAISQESAAVAARVDGLERREGQRHA